MTIFLVALVGAVESTWPMWGGDPAHQSLQLITGAMTAAPVVKWTVATNGAVEWQHSAIADVDGDLQMEVVMGSFDSTVYCVNGATGAQKWSFHAPGQVLSSPAVADVDGDDTMDVLVSCGSMTGIGSFNLYCLNGVTGAQQWAFPAFRGMGSSPAIADVDGDGQMEVVIGSYADSVYCVNGENGSQQWVFATSAQVNSSPAVANVDGDDTMEVIVGCNNSRVYCLNGVTGAQQWSYLTGAAVASSPAVADVDGDGQQEVIVGSYDGNVYCLSGAGSQEWVFPAPGMQGSSAAIADVDGDGQMEVIIGTGNRNVYCLSGTGSQQWVRTLPAPSTIHTVLSLVDIDGDNKLEVLVPNGAGTTFYCLNAEDGSILWQKEGFPLDIHSPFAGDIDGDQCAEIMVGTLQPTGGGSYIFALDDASNTSGCGPLYSGVNEGIGYGELEFKMQGQGIYLFLPSDDQVSLLLYDISGKFAQKLYDGVLPHGGHTFIPNLETRGIYMAVLQYGGTKRVVKFVR